MLKLILPILFPSWRFFSGIGASPRIDVSFLKNETDDPKIWHVFRPLPKKISFIGGLQRLLSNPQWNETLYINTCAEHLFDHYSLKREQEIMRRVLAVVNAGEMPTASSANFLLYRITAVIRENNQITRPVVFMSRRVALSGEK